MKLITILFILLFGSCNSNETNCKILKSKQSDYKKMLNKEMTYDGEFLRLYHEYYLKCTNNWTKVDTMDVEMRVQTDVLYMGSKTSSIKSVSDIRDEKQRKSNSDDMDYFWFNTTFY